MRPATSKWVNFGLPDGASAIGDVDATNDAAGRCQLFAVAKNGSAFTRRMTSETTWASWSKVATGSYRAITAGKEGTKLHAMMITTTGQLFSTRNAGTHWSRPRQLRRPTAVKEWIDADFGYDRQGRTVIYAYGGGDTLYHQRVASLSSAWMSLRTYLWVLPQRFPKEPAPALQTITASRWLEDQSGVTTPNIFATDDKGNVYFIEVVRGGGLAVWIPEWKSFYTYKLP